ncbi:MAG: proton-conducting transporter membrane subunit [Candidatus Fermentibacteraceae bacterium]
MNLAELMRLDTLAIFCAAFSGLFFLLTTLYSTGFMKGMRSGFRYYLYLLVTLVATAAALFADNVILLLALWGFLGLMLYLLIGFGRAARTADTAKKTMIIIGGSDALMLMGLGLVWHLSGTDAPIWAMRLSELRIPIEGGASTLAFLLLAAGALAKAGAMPLHTWIPDTAEDAPIPVTAYLPASLDKLLGIYLLARLCLEVFVMSPAMNTVLMAVGSFTIVAAVMMALVQHDLRRLLGYHAVSQVGYMVLGIGTGTMVGIAGGLFHMLNHAIYKACLFYTGGAVVKRAGTADLRKLGGYAKVMPVVFTSFLVAALAISGVPPLNGFASKWMVYQGVIETGADGGFMWVVWLAAAMIGSALTLASFMKLSNAVFLGQPSKPLEKRGSGAWAGIPAVTLAALCLGFGVLAQRLPLRYLIFPSIGAEPGGQGIWQPGMASVLLLGGLLVGLILYLIGKAWKGARVSKPFVGGVDLEDHPDMRVSGADFYLTVSEMGPLKRMYALAEARAFDIYEQGKQLVFELSGALGAAHSGVLSRYLGWYLLGMAAILAVLVW